MSLKVYQSKLPKYAGHTAGPWEVGKNTSSSCYALAPRRLVCPSVIPLYKGEDVLDGLAICRGDSEIRKANAALIADAPFLACEVERLTVLCGELQSRIKDLESDLGISDERDDDVYDDRQGSTNIGDYR